MQNWTSLRNLPDCIEAVGFVLLKNVLLYVSDKIACKEWGGLPATIQELATSGNETLLILSSVNYIAVQLRVIKTHNIKTLLSLTRRLYLSHVTTVWRPLSVAATAKMNDETAKKIFESRILKLSIKLDTIDILNDYHVLGLFIWKAQIRFANLPHYPNKLKAHSSAHSNTRGRDQHWACSCKALGDIE